MEKENIADRLARRFFTRDPFVLARELNRIVIEAPLIGIRGYYQRVMKSHIIYVHNSLNEFERQFVCAHELGHSVLHPHLNAIYMDSCTHFKKAKYEIEADRFAIDLLMPCERFADNFNMSAPDIAEALGICEDLANYCAIRMQWMYL